MLTSNLVACRASGFFLSATQKYMEEGQARGRGGKKKEKKKHLPAEPMKLKGGINVTVIKEQRYRQLRCYLRSPFSLEKD